MCSGREDCKEVYGRSQIDVEQRHTATRKDPVEDASENTRVPAGVLGGGTGRRRNNDVGLGDGAATDRTGLGRWRQWNSSAVSDEKGETSR